MEIPAGGSANYVGFLDIRGPGPFSLETRVFLEEKGTLLPVR